MRVSIHGSMGTRLCQIDALRRGFAELGHEHVDDPLHPDVAFVFVGNAPHDKYLHLVGHKKLILNVLDLPHHLVHDIASIIARHREVLPFASRVTSISETAAQSIRDIIGVECTNIYYPMKPVAHTGVAKYPQFKVLMAGRMADPNKHAGTLIQGLIRAGYNESEVAVVGSDKLGWGTYLGMVSDEVLNDLMNSVEYVMCGTKNTGLELPPAEAAICGAIPIVLPHLETFDELWAQSPLGLHYQLLNSPNEIGKLMRSLNDNPTWKATVRQDMLAYGQLFFRPKLEPKEVARRIIEVAL